MDSFAVPLQQRHGILHGLVQSSVSDQTNPKPDTVKARVEPAGFFQLRVSALLHLALAQPRLLGDAPSPEP